MKDSLGSFNIGIRLKSIRERKGMTVSELSVKTGISSSYLCRIENGQRKSPSITIIEKLAKGLGVTLETLISQEVYICQSCSKRELMERIVSIIDRTLEYEGKKELVCILQKSLREQRNMV